MTKVNYEEQIETLVKSGSKAIEVVSYEWERVHGFVNYVAEDLRLEWYSWSSVVGLQHWNKTHFDIIDNDMTTLASVLQWYMNRCENMILLLEDPHGFLDASQPVNIRFIRECIRHQTPDKIKSLILSTPTKCLPDDLSKELAIIEVDLPDRDTLEIIADSVVRKHSDDCLTSNISHKLLESALGLTVMEAETAFAKAIIQNKQLTDEEIPLIISEKEQVIKKSGLLEYFHPTEYMNNIGGLENLKAWINQRGKAYNDNAKEFGLNTPRGLLLLGVPGCGKSLTAKAIANEWKFPLLRFDLGKVFGGIVGESEKNIRYALDVAKTISPCILWIDEIEKGLSGSKSSGQTDGGTSARVFGTLLTWLQEKTEPVFVVATANDISSLPPELLRKGRFDEIFFVDLPSKKERQNIFEIHFNAKNRDVKKLDIDLDVLSDMTIGFSGAEISEVVNESLFVAYSNNQKDVTLDNVVGCIQATSPLSKTMGDNITQLRKWAKFRTRLASTDTAEDIKTDQDMPQLETECQNIFIASRKNKQK